MKNLKSKIIYPIFFIKSYKAIHIAKQLFDWKYRKTWEPLFCHSYRMFQKSITYGIYDELILNWVLLHDLIEDSFFEVSDIEKIFGSWVASIVEAMTCEKNNWIVHYKIRYIKKFKKFSLREWRILFIKLIDCIDNLETIHWLEREKQILFIREKSEVYLPIFKNGFRKIPNIYQWIYKKLLISFVNHLTQFKYE